MNFQSSVESCAPCPRCGALVDVVDDVIADHPGRYEGLRCDGSGVPVDVARFLAD